MNEIPADLHYSDTHEWVRKESDGSVTIGVTDHAQEAMGDMVFVELPEVGAKLAHKGDCGVLESVKSASDFYTSVAGEIIAVNEKLLDDPALINKDPYGEGWIVKIKPDNQDDIKNLMDADSYKKLLEE